MTFDRLLAHDHRECDDLLARTLDLAQDEQWIDALDCCIGFEQRLETHFRAEESVLFPRFEELTGMRSGPTVVMRNEHASIREQLGELAAALRAHDANAAAGHGEALLILIQQHNLKEETVLYPATLRAAGAQAETLGEAIRDALRAHAGSADGR